MTTADQPTISAERLTAALLEVAATARWPDGSLLLDLAGEVLRAQLAPKLLAVLNAPCPAPDVQQPPGTCRTPTSQPKPPQPVPPPTAPQEHTC